MLAAAIVSHLACKPASARLMRVHPDHADLPTSFNELTAGWIWVIVLLPQSILVIKPLFARRARYDLSGKSFRRLQRRQ